MSFAPMFRPPSAVARGYFRVDRNRPRQARVSLKNTGRRSWRRLRYRRTGKVAGPSFGYAMM